MQHGRGRRGAKRRRSSTRWIRREDRNAIRHGHWWRLVTAGFLHGGLLHIFMNSWVLFSVGAQVEETYGTARFLVLYFVSNVLGSMPSTLFSPVLSIGASAALFGLIGAMIAAGMRPTPPWGHDQGAIYAMGNLHACHRPLAVLQCRHRRPYRRTSWRFRASLADGCATRNGTWTDALWRTAAAFA